MKLIVRVGYVFNNEFGDDYFEEYERYEEEVESFDEANKKLKEEYHCIYDIHEKRDGSIVACVY